MKKIYLLIVFFPLLSFGQFHLGQIKSEIGNLNLQITNIKALAFSENENFLFVGSLNNVNKLVVSVFDINQNKVISSFNTNIDGFRDFRPSPSGKQLLIRDYNGTFQLHLIPDINNPVKIIPVGNEVSGNLFEYDYCWQNENIFESYLGVFDIDKWKLTNLEEKKFVWNNNVNEDYVLRVTNLCQSDKHNAFGRSISVLSRENYNEEKVLINTLCNAQAISYKGKYVAFLGDYQQLKLLTIKIDTSIKEKLFCVVIPNFNSYPDETIQTLNNLLDNKQLVRGIVLRTEMHPITNKPIVPSLDDKPNENNILARVQFTKLVGDVLYVKLLKKYYNNFELSEGDYIEGAYSDVKGKKSENLNYANFLTPDGNLFKWISPLKSECFPNFTDRKFKKNNEQITSESNNVEEIKNSKVEFDKNNLWVGRNPLWDTSGKLRWFDTKNNFYIDSFKTDIYHINKFDNSQKIENYYYNSIIEILGSDFELKELNETNKNLKRYVLELKLENEFKGVNTIRQEVGLALFSRFYIYLYENGNLIKKAVTSLSTNAGIFNDTRKTEFDVATDYRNGKLQKEIKKFVKDFGK